MTTTPTASPELPDLDHLEALARAANPGPWEWWTSNSVLRLSAADGIDGGVLQAYSHRGGSNICCGMSDRAFIAAANPAAVLALIALARRARPYATGGTVPGGLHLVGEAPQATCTVPPEGWHCTRAPGHDGPCAAWPIAQQAAAPGALAAWFDAEQKRLDAVTAYNAVALVAEREIWPGRDVNPEFQAMSAAQNAEFHARGALFASRTSAPGTPEAPAEDRKGIELWRATLRACGELPEGYEVCIELENGCGMAVWYDAEGERHVIDGDGYLSDDVNEAVDAAIQRAAQLDGGQEGSES